MHHSPAKLADDALKAALSHCQFAAARLELIQRSHLALPSGKQASLTKALDSVLSAERIIEAEIARPCVELTG